MTSSSERVHSAESPQKLWQFWIDRGGTFTDVVARSPDGTLTTTKLLSDNPEQYADAALAGIRRILAVAPHERIPVERIESIKMGTTVATNALLERKGEPTVLFITRGFRDQLRIGYQNRPRLFVRQIRLPELLYSKVVEVEERVDAHGKVLRPLDESATREAFAAAHAQGFRAAAIVFLHSFRYAAHELRAGELARAAGFTQVSLSHEVSPLEKVVSRGDTTVVDAYLSPILRRHVRRLEDELAASDVPPALYFMKSDGGLSDAASFRGKDAILSGPAGGIVGMVRTGLSAGFDKLIGFDMGGTSTDVSHFSGRDVADFERAFETLVAGVRMRAPMLAIHTIAAGGGSRLHFDGQRFRVGPDSAGANPGPACYRRGGALTITDCNVLLGKIQPAFFPKVFGPSADEALDVAVVAGRFSEFSREIRRATGRELGEEQIAEGFLRVAVTNMANAIRLISVQQGHDVTEYTLACFGGAGAQHACSVADALGMSRIFIHSLAGVLSAFGMGLAELTAMRQQAFGQVLAHGSLAALESELERLSLEARAELEQQGAARAEIEVIRRVHVKYDGTDTSLVVRAAALAEMREQFELAYRRQFAFSMPERKLVVEALSVEAVARVSRADVVEHGALQNTPSRPLATTRMYSAGAWHEAQVFERDALGADQSIEGPALIVEPNSTIVVESGWRARRCAQGLLVERYVARPSSLVAEAGVDPVLLEVFNSLFMSIAEQMGMRLQNTAHSVNMKERLDFSCAIFDAQGSLVANAPHMPVHLGSMGESIKAVMRKSGACMRRGDVFALNDPYDGGTHLPDITVVMPVFAEAGPELLFYVAARGHHADIGGITPGSMPPLSRNIEEEGVLIDHFKLVSGGELREAEFRALLGASRYPARNPDQNVADVRAQIAACEKGRVELLQMVRDFGLASVRAYMGHVQDHAEASVRTAIEALNDGEFSCALDDGAVIHVRVTLDRVKRSARVDFSGTSAELPTNFNAPPAVVQAAVLYVFRCLVDADIPMNAGCLRPIEILIPEGSLLSPRAPAATVAGNVETSQCVTDALFGALGTMAASQGTMNNFTFGNERYQYYETIAGGSGAGDGFDGTAAVQTHMTNSRLTDPEVLEARFPVLVEGHSIRAHSGGDGRFRGGDGALRRIRFLEPMTAAILAGRRRIAPYGLAGGAAGECGASWVERADGRRELLGSADQVEVAAGDVFVVSTPSGGGYGSKI